MTTTLTAILDAAECDNFRAKHALWKRYAAAVSSEPANFADDQIIPADAAERAITWARREVERQRISRRVSVYVAKRFAADLHPDVRAVFGGAI